MGYFIIITFGSQSKKVKIALVCDKSYKMVEFITFIKVYTFDKLVLYVVL